MASTVTITNNLTNPRCVGKAIDTSVISPTGITCPCTPYTEYTSDMVTILDGSVSVPMYNKLQYAVVPAGATMTFTVEDYKEVVYYEQLVVEGCTIVVDPEVVVEAETTEDSETDDTTGEDSGDDEPVNP